MEGLRGIVLLLVGLGVVFCQDRDFSEVEGYMEPFGSGKLKLKVLEVEGFPDQKTFLKNHIQESKPLKMKGAATLSPAFNLWTDEYLMSLDIPADSRVHLETRKKENRQQRTVEMNFKDFLKIYNETEHYMVDDVPEYLGKDVVFPCPLQCQTIMEECVVASMMWFSSGGTKSVVHADAVDNINCLFRGEKTFVMVDTNKHRDKVDLDHPEGLYSSVDVDRVDYYKFPGLADVEYYHINLKAGDCLYIPYRWVHQVRSFGSNVAVNTWWDHHASISIDPKNCDTKCNTDIRLNAIHNHGLDSITLSIGSIKDQFTNVVAVRSMDLEAFKHMFAGERIFDGLEEAERKRLLDIYHNIADEFFELMDADIDGKISSADLTKLPEEAWWDAQTYVREIEQLFGDDDEDDEDDLHDEL